MTKTKFLKIPVLLALMALVAAPWSSLRADEGGSSDKVSASEKGGHGQWKKMVEELGLSKDQKTKMKDINKKFRADSKAFHEEMKKAHEDMQAALKDSGSSESTLRAKHAALIKLMEKHGDLRFEKTLAIRALLTPEQLAKFAEMHQMHGMPRMHHGRRGYSKDGE